MNRVEELSRVIAEGRGHKDTDAVVIAQGGERIPVWKFYERDALRITATTPGMSEDEARRAGVPVTE